MALTRRRVRSPSAEGAVEWRVPRTATWYRCVALAALVAVASGVATGAPSGGATTAARTSQMATLLQTSAQPPALLDYFTFVPQALLLLFLVGLRRYVLDEEDVPWWLDGDRLRARIDALVPNYGQRLRKRILARLSRANAATEQSDDTTTSETDGSTGAAGTSSTDTVATGTAAAGTDRNASSTSPTASSGATSQSTQSGASRSGRTGHRGEPIPDRLALAYGKQRLVVADGDTVDEQIRAMLRAADEGEHAKWIDDRHLHFIHDEHGFTLVVDGDNPTRLNGDRMRPGDRARVYPGDEIDLSGVVTLAVERA